MKMQQFLLSQGLTTHDSKIFNLVEMKRRTKYQAQILGQKKFFQEMQISHTSLKYNHNLA
jgi:hypothetical protein